MANSALSPGKHRQPGSFFSWIQSSRDSAPQLFVLNEAGLHRYAIGFADVPVAIQIPPGEVEQLYGRDLTMENVSRAVLQVGDVRNLRSAITLDNVGCTNVSRFVEGENSLLKGSLSASISSPLYLEDHFSLGLEIGSDGRERGIAQRHQGHRVHSAPKVSATDIPALPPMQEWANVRELGAKGDGGTDDTAVIQEAVNTHPVLYFPSGAVSPHRFCPFAP